MILKTSRARVQVADPPQWREQRSGTVAARNERRVRTNVGKGGRKEKALALGEAAIQGIS